MRPYLIILVLIALTIGCDKKDKKAEDKNSKENFITDLFRKKIDQEFIDSMSIDSFINKNPDFKQYRNKMQKFYSRRNYSLAWSFKGEFLPQADMFINLVYDVNSHGLKPYKVTGLRSIYKETTEAKKPHLIEVSEKRKKLDLLLTATYFQYAQHIWRGNVDPQNKMIDWNIDQKKIKYGKTLDSILLNTESENPFEDIEPLHNEYYKLKKILLEYKQIRDQGGWPALDIKPYRKIKKGNTSKIVTLIKKRLLISKDLQTLNDTLLFDSDVEAAVKKFQRRHGLEDNGIISGKTIDAMNIPVEKRIDQIVINMERWRWVPQIKNQSYVWVNIPEYKLHIYENEKELWSMNVIVGKAATSTPIFNDKIEYIVTSPSWNVPQKIITDELIPMILRDSTTVYRYNIEILKNNNPIDHTAVSWDSISEDDIKKYTFKQRPGQGNALGNIKFIFPNEYDVYLHDTPTDYLFEETERDFSHGCIRIEDPLKFAEYLLNEDSTWSSEKIIKAMLSGEEQYVKLKKKVPVYIVYFTTWVDENGLANFREDIYKHDKKLTRAFFEK